MDTSTLLSRLHRPLQVNAPQDFPLRKKARSAAVLIPIVERESGLTVLLTERAKHLRHHPGQIAFPGGKIEDFDESAATAALREAEEEIGLAPHHVEIVGQLSHYRTITGFSIQPFIGLVKPDFSLTIDKSEVASAFEVPLIHLLHPSNQLTHTMKRDNTFYDIYFIPFEERLIWGATAAILHTLSLHLAP